MPDIHISETRSRLLKRQDALIDIDALISRILGYSHETADAPVSEILGTLVVDAVQARQAQGVTHGAGRMVGMLLVSGVVVGM